MNFDSYTTAALRTSTPVVSSEELYSRIGIYTLGLVGEAGEVAEIIKKYLGHGHPLVEEQLALELGDVLWYLTALADLLDISLHDIANANVAKLDARYPEGFTHEASRNRVRWR